MTFVLSAVNIASRWLKMGILLLFCIVQSKNHCAYVVNSVWLWEEKLDRRNNNIQERSGWKNGCCFAGKRLFCDVQDILGRLCVTLKWLINLFPSNSQPQGEDESLEFIGHGSRRSFIRSRIYRHIYLGWKELFLNYFSLLPFKLIRKASSSFNAALQCLAYQLCFLFEPASFSVFIWN